MSFDNDISFNGFLTSLESTLSLEMQSEQTVQEIIDAAVIRLENMYACTLDADLFTIQGENALVADNISHLLRDLQMCLCQIAFYTNLKLYHTNMAITLSDVNYLGYSKAVLLTSLKYLQYEKEAESHREDIIKPLYNTLNNITMCTVKRLFISMLMLDRLGVYEGVAVIAQLLYTGGLVV